MSNYLYLFSLVCILFMFSSCEQVSHFFASTEAPIPDEEREILARVYDDILYKDQLNGILEQVNTSEDSLNRMQRYVDNWVKKRLILHEAEKNTNFDKEELEQRLLDYKYQLLVYDYQRQFVDKNMDKEVTPQEIKAYYESNTANFELKKNIVKAYFAKLKSTDPKVEKVRSWMKSNKEENLQRLREHAYQFAQSYSLNDSLWMPFDNLVLGTPISPESYLQRNRFLEAKDSAHIYFLRILDYRTSDETSPLEFVRDQIKIILLNRRKLELQEKLEEEILRKARQRQSFEIFVPETTG